MRHRPPPFLLSMHMINDSAAACGKWGNLNRKTGNTRRTWGCERGFYGRERNRVSGLSSGPVLGKLLTYSSGRGSNWNIGHRSYSAKLQKKSAELQYALDAFITKANTHRICGNSCYTLWKKWEGKERRRIEIQL